jgi:hypothetical protein
MAPAPLRASRAMVDSRLWGDGAGPHASRWLRLRAGRRGRLGAGGRRPSDTTIRISDLRQSCRRDGQRCRRVACRGRVPRIHGWPGRLVASPLGASDRGRQAFWAALGGDGPRRLVLAGGLGDDGTREPESAADIWPRAFACAACRDRDSPARRSSRVRRGLDGGVVRAVAERAKALFMERRLAIALLIAAIGFAIDAAMTDQLLRVAGSFVAAGIARWMMVSSRSNKDSEHGGTAG